MKRRNVLAGLSVASAVLAWPTLISRAFADEDDRTPADAFSSFEQAWRDAQANHRPLLVLVIPSDPMQGWDRGRAFGAVINHGTNEALQAIGTSELACARMREVRRLFPNAPTSEPLMLVIRGPGASEMQALDAPWPPEVEYHRGGSTEADDARLTSQMAIVTQLLQAGLGANVGALSPAARRVAQQRAITDYRSHRVPGSHWANSGGCGTTIEDVPVTGGIGCGMGHVPEQGRRFLFFFAVDGNPT